MKANSKVIGTVFCFTLATILLSLSGCSTTSALPDGEQLYTGLKKVEYKGADNSSHCLATREELDAALATAPNGALFGSSYYRTPFQWRLWLWNATAGKTSGFAHWLNKNLASEPVLMSDVNPTLRATVAQSTLKNNGYFRGMVSYEELTMKNPKKGKIAYTVDMGHLFTIDTVSYTRFPTRMDSLILTSLKSTYLKRGEGVSISNLDLERQRLSSLFRNDGYYYYQSNYSSYLADTLATPGAVQLRLQLLDSLDSKATRRWYIGNTDIYLRKQGSFQTPSSRTRRSLTMHFEGRRIPMRTRAVLSGMKLRPRQPFSEDAYNESLSSLTANESFSSVDFRFTPRDTTATCDTLDMAIHCLFDKPWNVSLEGKFMGKTTSRIGPGAEATVARHNLFRYGEKISLKIYGSIEWQTGGSGGNTDVGVNSYEYGGDLTLEIPRLVLPFDIRRRWHTAPTTLIKASSQVINRAGFFNRHIMSGELTYTFQPNETSKHIISPLILEYDYMNRTTADFEQVLEDNPYLKVSMQDQFIPKIRYTYAYSSPSTYRNPVSWETTVSEAANIISLGYVIAGKGWNEKNKKMIRNPYAQFVKVETDFTKKWLVGEHTSLVGHISAGVIYDYGNSEDAPYSEQFYVGGANTIRAFTARAIGPGRYRSTNKTSSYFDQTGDIKFVANLEYRPRLFGSLYGALFLDAGNVWAMEDNAGKGSDSVFKWGSIFKDMAIGTGVGIRYDLDFFVIRVDWGVGLHMPYDTGKSGFFNINKLSDCQSIHLAIGYPF